MDRAQSIGTRANNPFKCTVCNKTYGRIDHLARHFRSHTNDKPFRCDDCGKSFSRADLLRRHGSLHTPEQSGKRRKIRASQACAACAAIKVRCDEEKPCKRCREKGIECHTDAETVPRIRVMHGNALYDESLQPSARSPTINNTSTVSGTPHSSHNSTSAGVGDASDSYVQPHSKQVYDTALSTGDGHFGNFLKDVFHTHPADDALDAHAHSSRDLMNFSDMNMDFNDLDGILMEDWSSWLDPALIAPNMYASPEQSSDASTSSIQGSINMGTAAYRRSAWKWVPNHEKRNQDQLQLSSLGHDTTAQSGQSEATAKLEHGDRDRMMAMLLSVCDKANFQKIVAMFPSTDILNLFYSDYCLTMEHEIDSWIHIPTLKPIETIPELLALMIIGGATLSPSSQAQRFGYALQETVRAGLPDHFESDNSKTRNLQSLQAFAVCLNIGIWSGIKRTTELSECAVLPLITMLRRSGRFRRSRERPIEPDVDDTPQALEQKWHAWVEAESFKRLAYHVFVHCVQLSIAMQIPPMISYAEVTLDLPASRYLWQATSAAEWRERFFAYHLNTPLPTLVATMTDAKTMGAVRDKTDLDFTLYLGLLSHWCLAWEYTQLLSVNKANTSDTTHEWAGTFLASTKHDELRRLLDSFHFEIESWKVFVPKENHMVSQLLRMNLCVAFEDLQLLAGKEGEEEARRVFPPLKQWYHSPECRQAMWHAGQVLRAARRPATWSKHYTHTYHRAPGPQTSVPWLRDFNAVALYHAALAFWVYGLLSRAITTDGEQKSVSDTRQVIQIDGDEEIVSAFERHQFIGLNERIAVISDPQRSDGKPNNNTSASAGTQMVALDDSQRVMEVMIRALTPAEGDAKKSSSTLTQQPAIVVNLVQLMRDLGDAAAAI